MSSELTRTEQGRGLVLNLAKMGMASVVIVTTAVLLALGAIDRTAGWSLISSIAGYVLGNGIAAYRGDVAPPVIAPTRIERTTHNADGTTSTYVISGEQRRRSS